MDTKRAAVILSPGFEETEAVAAVDVLRRAGIDAVTVSLEDNTAVESSHHLVIAADRTLSEAAAAREHWDAIVLPGGMGGVSNMLSSQPLLDFVMTLYASDTVMAAVCAGPLVFDKLHILPEGRFTCHPCVHDRLMTKGVLNDETVTEGRFVTGRSAGCAMVWSLALAKKLCGGTYPESLLPGLSLPDM